MCELEVKKRKLIKALESGQNTTIETVIGEINELKLSEITLDSELLKSANINTTSLKIQIKNSTLNFHLNIIGLEASRISFHRCSFKEEVLLNSLDSSGKIEFIDCRFKNGCTIETTQATSISFIGNIFYNKNIIIRDLNSIGSINFTANSNINTFYLKNFVLEKINLSQESSKREYKDIPAVDCQELIFEKIISNNITLNQRLQVHRKMDFTDCLIRKMFIRSIRRPTSNAAFDLRFSSGSYTDLSIQSVNLSSFVIDSASVQNLDIELNSKKTIVQYLKGKKDQESNMRLNGNHEYLTVNDLKLFNEISFLNNFKTANDLYMKDIASNKVQFSDNTTTSIYNFNIFIFNLNGAATSFIPFIRKPSEVIFNRIRFIKNLDIRDSYIGENNWSQCEFMRNLDFSRVNFKIVPKLHNINFTDTCHVNFVSCQFEDYGNIEAESSYRSLKNQSIRTNYDYGEHLFTSLELRSRLSKFRFYEIEKIIGMTGWQFNKFGESIMRPFLWWLGSFIAFSIICYQYDAISVVKASNGLLSSYNETWLNFLSLHNTAREEFLFFTYRVKNLWTSISYSLMNSIVVFKFTTIAKFLYPKHPFFFFLGMLQSVFSSIMIYLFIIGIKKRFRQK